LFKGSDLLITFITTWPDYEDAALKTQSSLAYLNFGQNVIFSSALSTAMVLSSYGVMSGALTVGDLVTIYPIHFLFVSYII
jgi:ABC transporter ATM